MAKKSTMAFEADPRSGFSRASSFMALSPKGVAELPRPIMLEDMFITIDAIAG